MSKEIKYLIIATLLFIFAIMISGCAEFPTAIQKGEIRDQLNCEPAESNGCAGWLPPQDD